ncbi:LysM peptidoglycan-binding domain-containing protein [Photobacterium damselae subsp. damselae]|uniref:LysM peptidoglycan-binding domain-containing protein n=1 Tax=Photobacterium damselae TaxID=38293 RepID=UPI0015F49F4B|nr:LysM peptidoglycan-binding domain-containing protein [Photobacterium damselae]MBA5682179.1 LysM peptidoglycan-binding domain-containing protein [Photobacterium damselae subsp. damselae]
MATHKIQKDECLSLIAQRYNTTVEALKKLNSEQIENIDLIYEGDVINITEPEVRIELPKRPTDPATGNSTCSAIHPDFIDILYVPSHPTTGKKTWYAITNEAKTAIEQEKQNLAQTVVPGNKEQTFNNLNKLGVLSKFATKPHDQFLTAKQKEEYHELLMQIVAIKSDAINFYKDGKEAAIIALAQQHGVNMDEVIADEITWLKVKDGINAISATSSVVINAAQFFSEFQSVEKQLDRKQKAISTALHKLIETLEDKISKLKKIAERKAQNSISDDGTKFVFDKKSQFFTSKKQLRVSKIVAEIQQNRPSSDEDVMYSSAADNEKYYENFWNNKLIAAYKAVNKIEKNPMIGAKSWSFASSLQQLNNYGYILKEQCLSKDRLIGTQKSHFGPQTLLNHHLYKNWREPGSFFSDKPDPLDYLGYKSYVIGDLYEELHGGQNKKASDIANEAPLCDWAYYPTLALISVIDLTLTKFKGDMKSLLGCHANAPDFLTQLLWVKKVALARKALLQKMGNDNAAKAVGILHLDESVKATKFTVIWDESKHKVERKRLGSFINKAGLNDLQVVECSLMSNGEVFWIRGPHWYIPNDDKDKACLGHVKDITSDISVVSMQSNAGAVGNDWKSALKALGKPETKGIDLSRQIASLSNNSAFWQDNYHYEEGLGPKGQSLYVADAQAQFLRFTSEGSAKINSPLESISGIEFNNVMGIGGELKGNVTLLSAQLSFSTWLPLTSQNRDIASKPLSSRNQPKGYHLEIPYLKSHPSSKYEREQYSAGYLSIKVSGQVYGLAAATCQLGTSLSFGPGDVEGTIGIKGSAINIQDYNTHVGQKAAGALIAVTPESYLKGVAEAKLSADVFIGVEAGGCLTGEVFWQPPSTLIANGSGVTTGTDLLSLGKVSGQASVNYGIGANVEFRLTYQEGCFVVVAAARLVAGPGCSGKVAIELNPDNADRFIACCLNVLNQSGFRQIAIFGDVDSNNINKDFMILNDYLTIAIALGLTLGEVMLLPMTEINAYKQEMLKDEYAPFLAAKIIDPKQRKKIQEWIRNLPPETLAKLFECLLKEQDIHTSNNERQVLAILEILKLMIPIQNDDDESKRRQFEETLFRMNTDFELKKSALAQWNNFGENWLKMAKFIKVYGTEKDRDDFNNYCSLYLCKNMEMRKKQKEILGIEIEDYLFLYSEEKLSKHERLLVSEVKKNDIHNYKRINWKINEI